MRLLLDTQVFLWFVADSPKLGKRGRALVVEATEAFVSAASVWEATIKVGIGKLDVDVDRLVQAIEGSGFASLPVTAAHAAAVAALPHHHRDPFDRLLVAQAMTEPMKLVTADRTLARYTELVTVL